MSKVLRVRDLNCESLVEAEGLLLYYDGVNSTFDFVSEPRTIAEAKRIMSIHGGLRDVPIRLLYRVSRILDQHHPIDDSEIWE